MIVENKDTKKTEWIDTVEALEIFKKHPLAKRRYTPNRPTLISWIKKHNLGYKFSGRWEVNKQKFIDYLNSGVPKNNG